MGDQKNFEEWIRKMAKLEDQYPPVTAGSMDDEQREPTIMPPGWWEVTDERGDRAFYQFREDGRSRGLRVGWWDWTYVQGTWRKMEAEHWLEWANRDPVPTAVFGEEGWIEKVRQYKEEWNKILKREL